MATNARIERKRQDKRGGLSVAAFIQTNRFRLAALHADTLGEGRVKQGQRQIAERFGLYATHPNEVPS